MTLNLLKNNVPKKGNVILIVVIIIAVAVLSTGVGYWLAVNRSEVGGGLKNQVVVNPIILGDAYPLAPTITPPGFNPTPVEERATPTIKLVSLPKEIVGLVKWHEPKKIDRLSFFITESANLAQSPETYKDSYLYYEVGNFSYQNKSGRVLTVSGEPQMGGASVYLVVNYDGTYILLRYGFSASSGSEYRDNRSIEEWLSEQGLDSSKFQIDNGSVLVQASFPKQLSGSKSRQILKYEYSQILGSGWPHLPAASELKHIFSDPTFGEVNYSTSTGAFYIYDQSGLTIGMYSLFLDFFNKDGLVPQITWNNGDWNTAEYGVSYVDMTSIGCGSSAYVLDVSDRVNIQKDLKVAGKNNRDDIIYEPKNNDFARLKHVFDNLYSEQKLDYSQFVQSRPLIYWVDPFGRLLEFENRKFIPAVECGKPVIYLYPTSTMDVNVVVSPAGGLTYSDPPMGFGWNVTAKPTGQLTEVKTGRNYPYLFWEGRGGIYEQPKNGFVIKKSEVSSFLSAKLKLLGLNKKEIADFKEFWLPRMNEKPYYFVTFLGNSAMNQLAPLTVDPAPNTVIRILMDYTPLDKPIKVNSFKFPRAPVRKGFTVVEWGGVLR